jgi:electron transport complex protein RnfG
MITKESMKPVISLTVIAFVVALLLGFVNKVTAPQIELRNAQADLERRQQVFAAADGFELLDGAEAKDETGLVQNVYEARQGTETVGYVFSLVTKGFGGPIHVTVGVDLNQTISGLRIGENSETAGLGSKAAEPAFYEQFTGKAGTPVLVVNGTGEQSVDGISSATITSKAVTEAAQAALDCAAAIQKGGQ